MCVACLCAFGALPDTATRSFTCSKVPSMFAYMSRAQLWPRVACSWFLEVRLISVYPRQFCATEVVFLGNTYFIENIADRETKLFFVQARKNVDPGESIVVQEGSGVSRRSSQGVISGTTDRSSGVGRRVAAS